MRLACEDIVNRVLPAVRSVIAMELKERGYSQTAIAGMMQITQPAVSQYLSAARGRQAKSVIRDPEAYEDIESLIEELIGETDDATVTRHLHEICLNLADVDEKPVCPH